MWYFLFSKFNLNNHILLQYNFYQEVGSELSVWLSSFFHSLFPLTHIGLYFLFMLTFLWLLFSSFNAKTVVADILQARRLNFEKLRESAFLFGIGLAIWDFVLHIHSYFATLCFVMCVSHKWLQPGLSKGYVGNLKENCYRKQTRQIHSGVNRVATATKKCSCPVCAYQVSNSFTQRYTSGHIF